MAEEVDPDIFDATSEMIGRIEKELGQDLYKYIYLSLTDHIAFAIKRNKEGILVRNSSKIAISICTLFVLPAKISELDLKYMSRLGLAYSF